MGQPWLGSGVERLGRANTHETVQTYRRQFLADVEVEGGEFPIFVRDEFEA